MKTLLALLLIIPSLSWGNHDKTIDIDSFKLDSDGRTIFLFIYNKTPNAIAAWNYVWTVKFKNGDERIYKTEPRYNGALCSSYSACTWTIGLGSRTDFKGISYK